MKYLAVIVLLILLFSCANDNPTKEQYDSLQKQLNDCNQKYDDLSNTPQIRLTKALKYHSDNNIKDAKIEFENIVNLFPGTDEAIKSQEYIDNYIKIEKQTADLEAKKKALGFKGIKEVSKVKVNDISISVKNTTSGNSFSFDSYGDEYRYIGAEKDEIYIVSKISVTSESKDPNLSPIMLYKLANGQLEYLGMMIYRFSRWDDYGSYLGNDADYNNDFAHTKTISFNCGHAISKNDFNNHAIFVVIHRVNCVFRERNDYGNPPINYNISSSYKPKKILNLNNLDKEYVLIKVFNKNKL